MKKKDVELLKGSIEKWVKVKQSVRGVDKGIDNCPLCIEYPNADCKGCPVYRHTGKTDCDNTPYAKWHDHQRDTHGLTEQSDHHHRFKDCVKCTKYASEMVGFLVGLLPVKEIRKVLD